MSTEVENKGAPSSTAAPGSLRRLHQRHCASSWQQSPHAPSSPTSKEPQSRRRGSRAGRQVKERRQQQQGSRKEQKELHSRGGSIEEGAMPSGQVASLRSSLMLAMEQQTAALKAIASSLENLTTVVNRTSHVNARAKSKTSTQVDIQAPHSELGFYHLQKQAERKLSKLLTNVKPCKLQHHRK